MLWMFIVGNGLVPFRLTMLRMFIVGNGLAPFRLAMWRMFDVYRRERSCAVPFDHVTEGVNAEGVKPLPYERWFNFFVGNGLAPFRPFFRISLSKILIFIPPVYIFFYV
jgi:hypothetical protein